METFLSVLVGIGLSAACGFRIFVPLLVTSAAALSGHLELADGFQWIGTWTAFTAFAAACGLEIAAYYIPWVDHALDTIATPAAVVAGAVLTASMINDFSPFLRWTLAIVAGGGAAGAVQSGTVLLRGLSGTTTGGLGNPLVATAELGGAVATSLIAVLAPVLIVAVVGLVGFVAWTRSRSSATPRKMTVV